MLASRDIIQHRDDKIPNCNTHEGRTCTRFGLGIFRVWIFTRGTVQQIENTIVRRECRRAAVEKEKRQSAAEA